MYNTYLKLLIYIYTSYIYIYTYTLPHTANFLGWIVETTNSSLFNVAFCGYKSFGPPPLCLATGLEVTKGTAQCCSLQPEATKAGTMDNRNETRENKERVLVRLVQIHLFMKQNKCQFVSLFDIKLWVEFYIFKLHQEVKVESWFLWLLDGWWVQGRSTQQPWNYFPIPWNFRVLLFVE